MNSAVIDDLRLYGPGLARGPARISLPEAQRYVHDVLRRTYENFTVASWLLPRRLRPDFAAVYAFCRWADDLADEAESPQRALELLGWWRSELQACYAGEPQHPVFVALRPVIERRELPQRHFDDLLDAFEQDQRITRYATLEDVVDYCHRSACPVGRLVLKLWGYDDADRTRLSDETCIALQLANFWQDVRRDWTERKRCYIPADIAAGHGLDLDALSLLIDSGGTGSQPVYGHQGRSGGQSTFGRRPAGMPVLPDQAFRDTILDLCHRTQARFDVGRGLLTLVPRRLRFDLGLFTLGGEAVLRKIRGQGGDTLTQRPRLTKADKAYLMLRATRSLLAPRGLS